MTRTLLTCSRRWYQKRIENSSPPTVRENTFLRKSHARKCSRGFTDSRHARFHPPPPILEEKACSYYLMAERCLRRWILRRCSGRDKIERRECGEKCAFRKFRDAGKGVAIWEQEIKLNFVKVGEGERGLDASKKRRYRVYLSSLARSMSPFLSPFPLSFALVLPLSCFCSLRSRNIRPDEIRFRGKSACPKSIATTSHYKGRPRKMAFEILREWWNCVSQRERDGNR